MRKFQSFFENRLAGLSTKSSLKDRNDVFITGGFVVGQSKTKTFLEAETPSLFGDLGNDEPQDSYDLQQNDTAQFSKTPVLFDEDDIRFLMQFPPAWRVDALHWRYGEGLFEAHKEIRNNGKPKDRKKIIINKVAFNVQTHIAPLIQKFTAKFGDVSDSEYTGGCYQYDLENWAISRTGDAGEVSYSTSNYKSPARSTINAAYTEWTKALARGFLGKTNSNMIVQGVSDEGVGRRGRRPKAKAVTVADLKKAGLLSSKKSGDDEDDEEDTISGNSEWGDLTDPNAVLGHQATVSLTWDGRIVDNSKGYFVPAHDQESIKKWVDSKYIDHRGQVTWAFDNPAEAQKTIGVEFSMPIEKTMQLLPGRMFNAAQIKPYITNDLLLKMKWHELLEKHPHLSTAISANGNMMHLDEVSKMIGDSDPIFQKLKEHATDMKGTLPEFGGPKPLTPENFVQTRLTPPHKKTKTTKFGGNEPQFETKAKFPIPDWKLKEIGISKNDYEETITKLVIGDDAFKVLKLDGSTELSPVKSGITIGIKTTERRTDQRGTQHVEALKDWESQMFLDSKKLIIQNNGLSVFVDFVESLMNAARSSGVHVVSHLFNNLGKLNLQSNEELVATRDAATKWARNRASKYVHEVAQLDLGYSTRKLIDRESKIAIANDPRGKSGVEDGGFNWASDIASLDSLKPTIANIKKLKAEAEVNIDSGTAAKIIALQSQVLNKAIKLFVTQELQQEEDTDSINMNEILKRAKKKAIQWLQSEDIGQNYIEKEMPDITPEEANLILQSFRSRKVNKALHDPLKEKPKELFAGEPIAGSIPSTSGLTSFDQFKARKNQEEPVSSVGVHQVLQADARNRMGFIKNPVFLQMLSKNTTEADKLAHLLSQDSVLSKSVEMFASANKIDVLHAILAKSRSGQAQVGT